MPGFGQMMGRSWVVVTLVALVLGGCGLSAKSYKDDGTVDLELVPQIKGNVEVVVYIHELDDQCKNTYLGRTEVPSTTTVRLKAAKRYRLYVLYHSTGFLAGDRSTRNTFELITANQNARYRLEAYHKDGYYETTLLRTDKRPVRKVKQGGVNSCLN